MQRKSKWIIGLGIAGLIATTTVNAGWNEFWGKCCLDYHRNNAWPEPFMSADRQIVRQHWELTEQAGWRLQNTLGNEMFDISTHELNSAGQKKIDWIMIYAPMQRRQVFVLRADNGQHTAQRLASIQQYLAGMNCDVPPVFEVDRVPPGIPGQYLQQMDQLYWSTQPAPRLPAASSGSTSSPSSGGSGGGSSSSGAGS